MGSCAGTPHKGWFPTPGGTPFSGNSCCSSNYPSKPCGGKDIFVRFQGGPREVSKDTDGSQGMRCACLAGALRKRGPQSRNWMTCPQQKVNCSWQVVCSVLFILRRCKHNVTQRGCCHTKGCAVRLVAQVCFDLIFLHERSGSRIATKARDTCKHGCGRFVCFSLFALVWVDFFRTRMMVNQHFSWSIFHQRFWNFMETVAKSTSLTAQA